jgi:hypothetical protein
MISDLARGSTTTFRVLGVIGAGFSRHGLAERVAADFVSALAFMRDMHYAAFPNLH